MTDRDSADEPQLQLHVRAFGTRLRAIRRAHDVTQNELADRTGLGRTHIADLEAGRVNASLTTLWRLARALGVHAADLIDDRER